MNPASRRSLLSSCLALLAVPGYLICVTHICKCGHLVHAHGQYDLVTDCIWIALFVSSAVFVASSDMRLRSIQCSFILCLVLSRVLLRSGGGWMIPIEHLGLLVVSCFAVWTIYRTARLALARPR